MGCAFFQASNVAGKLAHSARSHAKQPPKTTARIFMTAAPLYGFAFEHTKLSLIISRRRESNIRRLPCDDRPWFPPARE
jgi:hypothetical protein